MKNSKGLIVIQPGLFTQLQDAGRYGLAKLGLSQGGVLDEKAANWANYLLHNRSTDSLLEISFGLGEYKASVDCYLALTGADMNAQIVTVSGNTKAQANNCSFKLKKGEHLKLAVAKSGVRAYLAVQGGFDITKQFSSNSTVKRNFIGGEDGVGGNIKKGDYLPIFEQSDAFITQKMAAHFVPDYDAPLILSVIESYQSEQFSVRQKEHFYNSEYCISSQSDRMGVRLTGSTIETGNNTMISEGITLGSIQIPADGLPIILLQDRQTLGGYPKIGVIARCDLSLLAQAQAGQKLFFKRTSLASQQLRYRQFLAFFNGHQ